MQATEQATNLGNTERRRVEAVVETLARLGGRSETLAEVAHDARNMVTALGLYCDLLEEEGVLSQSFVHYGSELRLVASASRRLVEKLVALDSRAATVPGESERSEAGFTIPGATTRTAGVASNRWEMLPAEPIRNLAGELLSSRNLLAALAGPSIALTLEVEGCAQPVRLTNEDLTRVLVNLVKNAAEAMPRGGRIQLSLREMPAEASERPERMILSIDDSGPGIPVRALKKIFESGFSSHCAPTPAGAACSNLHRGLGLSITRSIIEAAGGSIRAFNRRAEGAASGARFEIELPLSKH